MKECSRCDQNKEDDEFAIRGGGKQSWCKECNRSYARQYYEDNKAKLRQDIRKLVDKRRALNERHILGYLASHPCRDCAETDPIVLEFDHVRGVKREVISTLVRQGYTLKTLCTEIEKCDVVCANCHRRRTAQRGNFYKVRLANVESV